MFTSLYDKVMFKFKKKLSIKTNKTLMFVMVIIIVLIWDHAVMVKK